MTRNTPVKEFVINNYITMKLIGIVTYIFVNGKQYGQCLKLLINITKEKQFISIDHAEYSSSETSNELDFTPEEYFIVHCSNMQAFAENDYNTNLLHRSISFPLLKKLYDIGDPVAKKVFISEIKNRCEHGHPKTILYIIENKYLEYLPQWFPMQLNNINSQVVENLIHWLLKYRLDWIYAFKVFGTFLSHISERKKIALYEKIKKIIFDRIEDHRIVEQYPHIQNLFLRNEFM